MKVFLLGILALAPLISKADYAPNGETRLCPPFYDYAGDDTQSVIEGRDIFFEEADRSPTYSCYKLYEDEDDWFSANKKCWEDKGQLISLEDVEEIIRFRDRFYGGSEPLEIMTSGIKFESMDWMWMGSNHTVNESMLSSDGVGQCLTVNLTAIDWELQATPCNSIRRFACETRVETVTYYAWFVANWFSVLLVFLVVVLVISLCVSATMYTRRPVGRVYRARPPVFDQPPSYNRATGATTGQRYVNKGKDMLAKVYLYKDNQQTETKQTPQA